MSEEQRRRRTGGSTAANKEVCRARGTLFCPPWAPWCLWAEKKQVRVVRGEAGLSQVVEVGGRKGTAERRDGRAKAKKKGWAQGPPTQRQVDESWVPACVCVASALVRFALVGCAY